MQGLKTGSCLVPITDGGDLFDRTDHISRKKTSRFLNLEKKLNIDQESESVSHS